MARRTLEQRARDTLRKLGVMRADTLTSEEVHSIACSLKRVKVSDDVSRVSSCISAGALPSRCANGQAVFADDHGKQIAEADVFVLSDGSMLMHGIGVATGTATSVTVFGQVIPLVFAYDAVDYPAIVMNTRCMMPGDLVTVSSRCTFAAD